MKQFGGASGQALQFGVTGGASGSNWSPTPLNGVDSSPDPFSTLAFPTIGACETGVDAKLQQANPTLSPGVSEPTTSTVAAES